MSQNHYTLARLLNQRLDNMENRASLASRAFADGQEKKGVQYAAEFREQRAKAALLATQLAAALLTANDEEAK